MSITSYHDLLLPGVRGRMDADLYRVNDELWLGRETGPRLLVMTRDETGKPWKDVRSVVVSRLEDAERQLGRANG